MNRENSAAVRSQFGKTREHNMIQTALAISAQDKDDCPFDLWRLRLQNACRDLNDTVPFLTASWKSSVSGIMKNIACDDSRMF